jgi:hypothetical protein
MIETMIARLEESIRLFEAYEEEIWPDQYEKALGTVRDLQVAIEQIRTPGSFIEVALLSAAAPTEAPIDSTALIDLMLAVAFAREQADHARLKLAAYQPHGRSKAQRHLQERQRLVGQLRALVKAAAKVRPTSITAEPGARVSYLRVVEQEEQSC